MGLRRLGIANPSSNTATTLFTADEQYLISVIATNKSDSASNINVWVQPQGSSQESQYAYIIYNLPVDAANSFETFRFAINQNDLVRVSATSSSVSFSVYGLVQYDVKLGAGISSYMSASPTSPVQGMIWIDSDASVYGSSSKPIYIYTGTEWVSTAASGIDTSANYTFTGTVNATTQSAGDNSTKVATTAFVENNFEKIIPLQSSAPLSPSSSDLWIDSSGAVPILKVYNGSSWVSLASPADDDQVIFAQRMFA
jgi:hypothetical protein